MILLVHAMSVKSSSYGDIEGLNWRVVGTQRKK